LFTEDLLGAASLRDFFAHKGAPTSHCEARQRRGNLLLKIGIDLESQTADEEDVEAVPHERIISSVKKTGVIVAIIGVTSSYVIFTGKNWNWGRWNWGRF